MSSYIRFQTGMRCRDTGRSLGIFHAAGRLQDDGNVEPYLADSLESTLHWFNSNLSVPKKDRIHWRCLFWFDCESAEVIGKVWELITWLRLHELFVQAYRCDAPGKIMYADSHQCAAIPSQRVRRVLKL